MVRRYSSASLGALGRCAGRDPERLEGAGLLVEGCDRVAFGLARRDLLELPAGEDFPDLAADFGLGRGVGRGRGLRGRGLAGGCGRARDRCGRCRACGRGSGFGRCGRPGDGSRCRLGRCDGTRDGCGRCRSGRGRRAGRRRRSVSGRGRRLRRGLCRGGSGGRCRSRLRRGGLDLRGGSGRRKRRDVAARLQSGAGVGKRAAEPQAGVGRHDRRRRLRHAARRAVVALRRERWSMPAVRHLRVVARTSASAVPAKMFIRALRIDAYSTCRASGAKSCE